MRFLKRFNEDLEAQETQAEVQAELKLNANKSSKYTECIDAARECIQACNQAIEDFKDADDLESVITTNECILVCELYIYSCENDTKNLKEISELTKTIVKDAAELKAEHADVCMSFVDKIENCEDSE